MREPLNPLNQKSLKEYYQNVLQNEERQQFQAAGKTFKARVWTYVGGRDSRRRLTTDEFEHKFEVPRITGFAGHGNPTHSPWEHLRNKNRLAHTFPFWLPREDNPSDAPGWHMPKGPEFITMTLHDRLRTLGLKNVSEPIRILGGYFAFGFRTPAAFLLWPNYKGSDTKVGTQPPVAAALTRDAPAYMLEPELRAGADAIIKSFYSGRGVDANQTDVFARVLDQFKEYRTEDNKLALAELVLNYDSRRSDPKEWKASFLNGERDRLPRPQSSSGAGSSRDPLPVPVPAQARVSVTFDDNIDPNIFRPSAQVGADALAEAAPAELQQPSNARPRRASCAAR